MAVLEILQFPDPRLRIKAEPVLEVTDTLRAQVKDMYETMYHAQGVGLAATQVDIHLRLFTMDCSESRDQGVCIVNPEIVHMEGTQYEGEGCLSVESAFDKVERAAKVLMRATNLDGHPIEMEVEGLQAICIQHEIDHLNGILFVDHLSRLKQQRIKSKLKKISTRK